MQSAQSDRLRQLLDLAAMHKQWTQVRLAKELGRNRTRLCPLGGDPKLSYLLRLAEIIEWPLETVIRFIRGEFRGEETAPFFEDVEFAPTYEHAYRARLAGDYHEAIEHARLAQRCRTSPNNRARAMNIEFTAWDSLGYFRASVRAVREALAIDNTSPTLHMTLRVNLAIGLQGTGDLIAADALSETGIAWFLEHMTDQHQPQIALAYAYFSHAGAHRRLAARYPERGREHMQIAGGEYRQAEAELERLAPAFDRPHLTAIANTCRGGRLEAEAALAARPAEEICEEMLTEIEDALEQQNLRGDWLESYGWWTVGGGNIALRHLRGRTLQRALERFTNAALAIARRMDNWAFRERALSMEHALRNRISEATGFRVAASIATSDVRWITGTIGRFPDFQETGWEILQDARLVK